MRVSGLLEPLRHNPRPLLGVLLAGLVAGFVLALATGGASSDPRHVAIVIPPPTLPVQAARTGAGAPPQTGPVASGGVAVPAGGLPAAAADDRGRGAMRRALAQGVAAAREVMGGSAEAAVWRDDWSAPVFAGDDERSMRMWSMSKAVTAVAVLRRQPSPSPELRQALVDALTRSENCPQRRVVMGLQWLTRGAEGARGAFEDVLATAQASAEVPPPIAPPEANCRAYLQQHAGALGSHALDPAYQYGTADWTVHDAIAFAHALGTGIYRGAGERTLALLRLSKEPGREPGAQLSVDASWGVGRTFPGWTTAYKSGWGGADTRTFLVGQIAVVQRAGRSVAVAAMVHPRQQPAVEDPGQAHAAEGLEALLREVSAQLDRTDAG